MYTLRSISVKTQVRRLKYLSIIVTFLNKKGTRRRFVYNRIIKWAKSNVDYFEKLPSSTGEIKESSRKTISNSFKNYIEGGSTLEIFNEYYDLLIPSKIGLSLKAAKQIVKEKLENNYKLENSEKLTLFYLLLKNDADRLLSVVSLIKQYPGSSLHFLQRKFKDTYKKRLQNKLAYLKDKERIKTFEALKRVENWRNEERYTEDIVPPRINWLLDLDLLDNNSFSANQIELNEKGKKIFFELEDINDDWLNSKYFICASTLINKTNTLKVWGNIKNKENYMIGPLKYCLSNFKVMNLPRLSIEQSFLFISTYLMLVENIIAEFKDIEGYIGFEKQIGNNKIGIRKAARKYESYIAILS